MSATGYTGAIGARARPHLAFRSALRAVIGTFGCGEAEARRWLAGPDGRRLGDMVAAGMDTGQPHDRALEAALNGARTGRVRYTRPPAATGDAQARVRRAE